VPRSNYSYFLSDYINLNFYVLFSAILLVIITGYFLFIDKVKGWGRVGPALIFAGGMLNLIERAFTGCVKDYLNFFGLFYYNIFDVLVSLGLAVFIFYYLKKDGK